MLAFVFQMMKEVMLAVFWIIKLPKPWNAIEFIQPKFAILSTASMEISYPTKNLVLIFLFFPFWISDLFRMTRSSASTVCLESSSLLMCINPIIFILGFTRDFLFLANKKFIFLSGHPWVQIDGVAPDKPLDSAVLSRLKQFSAMNKLKKMALKVSVWMWRLITFEYKITEKLNR